MPRLIERLSKSDIKKARAPGLYPDGNGLYLQVTERGTKSWVLLYKYRKRRRKMGLGPLRLVDLAEARKRQGAAHKQLLDGVDPLALRAKRRAKAASAKTFRDAARQYIRDHEAKWKNPKHVAQWYMTLLGETREGEKTKNDYCALLHGVPVADVDTALVLSVLRPIWHDKPETASRLRGRIETVLGWAMVNGLRAEQMNPARWDGHLANALPEKGEVREVKHHAAPPYAELPAFMAKLKGRAGLAARALQLAILTAVRTGDLIGNDREERPPMKRQHVDLAGRMWTIPKTKTNVEHRVPLSDAAVELLTQVFKAYPDDGSGIVFVGDRPGQPMSSGAMLRVRDRMVADGLIKKGTVTPHGIARACFKSWASDETNFEKDVVEACLTHTISDKLEAAYRRSDFYSKRTRLMAAWADFVEGKAGGNVLTPCTPEDKSARPDAPPPGEALSPNAGSEHRSMKIQKPFGTFFQSANHLFRVALGDGYTPQQACAAIRDLIELGCVVAPALTLPVRVDPSADGGVIITDAIGAKIDGARVLLRHPGPEGLRLRTPEDRRIVELAEMLVADPLTDRTEAFNALAERHPGLTDLQFDHDWAAAHRELQRTPKPGPKPGKPRKRQAVRRRTPRESRK